VRYGTVGHVVTSRQAATRFVRSIDRGHHHIVDRAGASDDGARRRRKAFMVVPPGACARFPVVMTGRGRGAVSRSVPDERANPQATNLLPPPARHGAAAISIFLCFTNPGPKSTLIRQGWYAHACVCQVPATVTTGTINIALSFRTTINQYPGISSIYPRIQRNPRQRHAAPIASQRRGKEGVRKQSLRVAPVPARSDMERDAALNCPLPRRDFHQPHDDTLRRVLAAPPC
jgi:hypothetical protein